MEQSFDFSSYNNIKRMSEDELVALWEKYLADKSNKQARDTLIVQYIYLVRYVVGRVKVSLPTTISIEDIAGYGVEGLINAIERFSPQKNTRFETYALIRVRGAILDRIRSEDFLPRSVRKKIKDIKQAAEFLKQELGRTPTNTEIANYLEMDPDKVSQIMSEDVVVTSIYEKRGSSEDSMEIIDTIETLENMDDHERECVIALMECKSTDDVQEAIDDLDNYTFFGDSDEYHDFCDESIDFGNNEFLERYFDYDAFHRDCDFDIYEASNGICILG
jgi:RNA polymerase sigma factor for flagellar operon FliA